MCHSSNGMVTNAVNHALSSSVHHQKPKGKYQASSTSQFCIMSTFVKAHFDNYWRIMCQWRWCDCLYIFCELLSLVSSVKYSLALIVWVILFFYDKKPAIGSSICHWLLLGHKCCLQLLGCWTPGPGLQSVHKCNDSSECKGCFGLYVLSSYLPVKPEFYLALSSYKQTKDNIYFSFDISLFISSENLLKDLKECGWRKRHQHCLTCIIIMNHFHDHKGY